MGHCCGPCHDRREDGEAHLLTDHPTLFPTSNGPIISLAFAPDGQRLAVSWRNSQLRLFDLTDGSSTFVFGDDRIPRDGLQPVLFSPDGKWLAASEPQVGLLRLWKLDGTKWMRRDLRGELNEPIIGLAFSPDSTWLVGFHDENLAYVWTLQGEEWTQASTLTRSITAACFSPDGERVAFGSLGGSVDFQEVFRQPSRPLIRLEVEENEEVRFLEYTPDGATLVLVTGPSDSWRRWHLRLWDLIGDRPKGSLPIPMMSSVALSPQGDYLAGIIHDTQHSPAEVHFWDARTLREAGRMEWDPEDDLRDLAFSPDGQALAIGSAQGTIKLVPWRLLLEA
jgi:WD40 repeat protein